MFLVVLPSGFATMGGPAAIGAVEQGSHSFIILFERDGADGDCSYTLCSFSEIGKRGFGQDVEEVGLGENGWGGLKGCGFGCGFLEQAKEVATKGDEGAKG